MEHKEYEENIQRSDLSEEERKTAEKMIEAMQEEPVPEKLEPQAIREKLEKQKKQQRGSSFGNKSWSTSVLAAACTAIVIGLGGFGLWQSRKDAGGTQKTADRKGYTLLYSRKTADSGFFDPVFSGTIRLRILCSVSPPEYTSYKSVPAVSVPPYSLPQTGAVSSSLPQDRTQRLSHLADREKKNLFFPPYHKTKVSKSVPEKAPASRTIH